MQLSLNIDAFPCHFLDSQCLYMSAIRSNYTYYLAPICFRNVLDDSTELFRHFLEGYKGFDTQGRNM